MTRNSLPFYWPIGLDAFGQLANIGSMEQALLDEIRMYCRRVGISPSTLGVRAVGNSRFFDRLKRKVEKSEADAERIRAYMADNPPGASQAKGAA